MKMKYYNLCMVVSIILAQCLLLPAPELYAGNEDHGRIREMSSKRNEELFDKIAIDLLNGKSRYVSLDNMVELLQNYSVVEFSSKDVEPAQDIILKEVAFRMLKQHYLPRVGDKIKVYKLDREFSKDAGIYPAYKNGHETAIRLPLEFATIQDNNKLKTIYWTDLVMQISTVIERLWFRRIRGAVATPEYNYGESSLLDATLFLRRKYVQQEDTADLLYAEDNDAYMITKAAEHKIKDWLIKKDGSKENIAFVAEMMTQYIILSGSVQPARIASELEGLKDIDSLKEALLGRIKTTSEAIKSYNPTDYAAFAMLQSMLNELSRYPYFAPNTTIDRPLNLTAEPHESRHSA